MSEKVAWRLKSRLQEQNLDGAQVAEIPRFLLVRDGGLCSYSRGFNRQTLLRLRHPLITKSISSEYFKKLREIFKVEKYLK